MKSQRLADFWQNLRENDFMLLDAANRKVAIYATEQGQVVIAMQDGENCCVTQLSGYEIEDAERLFAAASGNAAEISARNDASAAISHAKKTSAKKRVI